MLSWVVWEFAVPPHQQHLQLLLLLQRSPHRCRLGSPCHCLRPAVPVWKHEQESLRRYLSVLRQYRERPDWCHRHSR
jgi:hypothetical protein